MRLLSDWRKIGMERTLEISLAEKGEMLGKSRNHFEKVG